MVTSTRVVWSRVGRSYCVRSTRAPMMGIAKADEGEAVLEVGGVVALVLLTF